MKARVHPLELLLLIALATVLLLLSPWAMAQNVAALEVACKPGTQHEKLDRIERKVDLLLGRQCVAPPTPPGPPLPPPTKPAEPPPPPAGPNPFIEWRAQGLNLVDIAVWRLGRGLTAAELEQAYAAGYPRAGAPAAGDPGAPGGVNPTGFDLGTGGGTVLQHQVGAGQVITFTFTVLPGGRPEIYVFGVSGTLFRKFTDSGPGFAGRVTVPNDGRHAAFSGVELAPGTYSYSVAVEPGGSLGITFPRQ